MNLWGMIGELRFKSTTNQTVDEEYQTTHWQAKNEYRKVLWQLEEKAESKSVDILKQL